MPQSISLSIKMNSSCHENWENMEPTEKGRFCNACQKAVIDFTNFTDQEILQYFFKNPFPVCGRILKTQKDRLYEYSKPKVKWQLAPIAASFLTLAAITAEAAPSVPLKSNISQAQLPYNKRITPMPADSVIISGTIVNEQGKPIENVKIVFGKLKTLSDKDGVFEFRLPPRLNKSTEIQFSYPGLTKEVRQYSPVAGYKSYYINLYEPGKQPYHDMGEMEPSLNPLRSLLPHHFESIKKLDSKTKTWLQELAQFMKDVPKPVFTLKSSYKTSKQNAVDLSNLIISYLVNKEGIAPERIALADPQLETFSEFEVIIEFAINYQ